MHYIGIAGHNKNRKDVALLLAKIIARLKNNKEIDWENIHNDSLPYAISIDSFGGYILSAIQTIFPSLWGLPLDDDDFIKSHWIDTETFNVYGAESSDYMRLDDFILYFANTMMKSAFGENVWVRLMYHELSSRTNELIIYHDVKTDAEQTFIKEHGGIIIGVNWSQAKQDKLMLKNPQFDVKIKTSEFNSDKLIQIAQTIIDSFNL